MVLIHIFETGDRFEVGGILSSDTIKTVKQKISIGTTLLLPPDWMYIWKLNEKGQEIPLEIGTETSIGNPHTDPEYKNGSPAVSFKDLSETPIGQLNVIFVSSIFIVFQKFLLEKRDDLVTDYILEDGKLPDDVKSSPKILIPFLKGYVKRYWPNIKPKSVGILLFWASDQDIRGDAKEGEIRNLSDKLIKEKNESLESLESEILLSKLVSKHTTPQDKIQIEQLTLSVNTKPSRPLDLFLVFRAFKLDSTVPFMKIKNPETGENLVNMLKSIHKLPQASIWVKNKPKGLNFKVKSSENKFVDVSMNSIGRFNVNCGRTESKVNCLKSIRILVDKINRNNRSDMSITNGDVLVSSLNMSIRDEREINHRDFINFILSKNQVFKEYYGISTREDDIEERQRLAKAGTKQAQRLAAQLKGLAKDTVSQITYKNKFTGVERINVKILKERDGTVIRVFGLQEISHGQEILNRTLAIIRELISIKKKALVAPKEVVVVKPTKNPVLDKLRTVAPNIFTTSSFSVKCGKDKQPLVWTKDEFESLDKTKFTYGLEYKNLWYTCRQGSVPGKKKLYNSNPGLQRFEDYHRVVAVLGNEEQVVGDNLSEKASVKLVDKFKKKNPSFGQQGRGQVVVRENKLKDKIWWPCCFKDDRKKKNAEIKALDRGLIPEKREVSEFLITTDKVLDPDRISNKLPGSIGKLFSVGNYFRYGTILSDSSLFVAVVTATKDVYRKMDMKSKEKFIVKTRKSIADKLPMKKFNAINGGELSGKITLDEYKRLIEFGVLNVDLAHDLLTRGFSKNIFIFSSREGNLVCSASGQITLERESIFLLENAPNHYEVIFTGSIGKKTFIFKPTDKIVKTVYELYKLNCPRIVENHLKTLSKKVKLVAQVQNHKGKIIYGITSGGIALPVKESRPLELPIKKLSSVKMTANETHRRLKLLGTREPEFKPESQILTEERTIAITLKNGSIVPTKASLKVPNFPVELDVDFSDDLDFFIKEEKGLSNAQTRFVRKETYSKELLERVRFELSEMFKDKPSAKEKITKSLKSRNRIKKALGSLIVAFDAPGPPREIRDKNDIPQRKMCKTKSKGSCLSDPFCRHRGGTCELSVTSSDKKRIIHSITNELYNLEKKSQILAGTVSFHGQTFVLRPDEVILEGVQEALDFLGKGK